MEQKARHDLSLSGVGSASGGTYHDVRINGVGKVYGDLDCVRCRVDGVADIYGNVKATTVQIRGRARVQGSVSGEEVRLEGDTNIAGNCEAETFHAAGAFQVDGLVNADQVSIRLHGSAQVKEIGGENISVVKHHKFGLFSRFKKLTAETIEGDDVHLEFTKANVVRGNRVRIGPGCEIECVEYRTDYQQAPEARVTESRKL